MAIIKRALRLLFPPGHAWTLTGTLGDLVDALAMSFSRLRTFFRGILTESLPGTAEETLPEWYESQGLEYNPTLPLAKRQKRAESAYVATGGQGFNYLQDRLQAELPEVYITESTGEDSAGVAAITGIARCGIERCGKGILLHSFLVQGYVEDSGEYNRLLSILARIFSLHLAPIMGVTNKSILGIDRCGIGRTGTARCGNVV